MTNRQKMACRRIAIIYRFRKKEAKEMALQMVKWLSAKGCQCYCDPSQGILLPGTQEITESNKREMDFALVLGGDGTYLSTVRMFHRSLIPILGVNMGSLGFLTQTSKQEIKTCLDKALKDELQTSNRTLLEVTVQQVGKKKSRLLALNDIVFERGLSGRLIYMSIKVDGYLMSHLRADGLVVSTPTGSTAYNLAAGGPIICPEVPAIVITPVCPHSLTNKPLTIFNKQTIELQLANRTQSATFLVDGHQEMDLTSKDIVVIKKARQTLQMLISPDANYFDILRGKLRFGQRD